MTSWHDLDIDQGFEELNSRPDGLDEAKGSERLAKLGISQSILQEDAQKDSVTATT